MKVTREALYVGVRHAHPNLRAFRRLLCKEKQSSWSLLLPWYLAAVSVRLRVMRNRMLFSVPRFLVRTSSGSLSNTASGENRSRFDLLMSTALLSRRQPCIAEAECRLVLI